MKDGLNDIAVAFQVAGAGADCVAAVAGRDLFALVGDAPVGIGAGMSGGVVTADGIPFLLPHGAFAGPFRRKEGDQVIEPTQCASSPFKLSGVGIGERSGAGFTGELVL